MSAVCRREVIRHLYQKQTEIISYTDTTLQKIDRQQLYYYWSLRIGQGKIRAEA